MKSNKQIEEHKQKVKSCLEAFEDFSLIPSLWENDFIESLDDQLSKNNDLTLPQIECLNRIYERIE